MHSRGGQDVENHHYHWNGTGCERLGRLCRAPTSLIRHRKCVCSTAAPGSSNYTNSKCSQGKESGLRSVTPPPRLITVFQCPGPFGVYLVRFLGTWRGLVPQPQAGGYHVEKGWTRVGLPAVAPAGGVPYRP